MPKSREIFTCDSLNDKSATFGFAAETGSGHPAAGKRDLRGFSESKRRVSINAFSCHSTSAEGAETRLSAAGRKAH
jgi:hypothetical protein